ncbi:LysM peptidoglycan-binding domain-containing protein [Lentibacillus sp. N15]|uniref:LysM peptidoglycan-binding domain-containing protein n=1 Tax=Lentibacillus songyuanensis TaxID=3136161 RepID=UPI0031BB769F
MQIHVVRRGETLWQIVQRYGSNLNQMVLVNQLDDPNTLVVGQTLVVPNPNREYVVQPGDQLGSIASRYGVSVQELAAANNITDPSILYVGEMLVIPYVQYVIQSGDTLGSIASRHDVTINLLMKANQLTESSVLHPGQRLRIPVGARPIMEINAYSTHINQQGKDEVLVLGRNFTYLSPFMYSVKSDGTITSMQETGLLEAARAHQVAPLLVLTNFSGGNFNSDLAATIFRNPNLQETLITNLLKKIQSKGYAGVNFDFEYVYPEDRDNYTAFLRRVVARFHPEGLLVSTALAPKVKEEQQGLLYEAHDYGAHGKIVDFVILMTYEWGWAGGEPWAIAPINMVREVLDYAVTVIPRNKIMMGIPLYGRDWKIPWQQGTTARTVSPYEAVQLAGQYGAEIQYNTTYQAPFFRYTDNNGQQHEVWFEDARSMQAKYDVMKAYGLRGGSYWVLGNQFPQNWAVLEDNFVVRKL